MKPYTKIEVVNSLIKKTLGSFYFQIKEIVPIMIGESERWGVYQEFIVISIGGAVKRVVFWEDDLEFQVTDMIRDERTRRVIVP